MSLYRNRHEKGTLLKNVLKEMRAFWRSFGWIAWSFLAASILMVGCQRYKAWVDDLGVAADKKAPSLVWTVVKVSYRLGVNDVRCAEVKLVAHDEKGRYVTDRNIVTTPAAPDYGVVTELHLGQKVKLQHSPTEIVGHTVDKHFLVTLPPGSK
jgi:hypothetical protein